tara:strand:+ start:208 stop:675 length:468 start_codon:yes stop_codon:yes gene_type:complete
MSNPIPEEFRRTVEIEGVKLEVDLRTAKKIDTYRVGDAVRVLIKDYSGFNTYPGCIVGFDDFKNRPTIRVAYIEPHSESPLKFESIQEGKGENEIAPMYESDLLPTRETIEGHFSREEEKLHTKLRALQEQRAFFRKQFGQAFERYRPQVEEESV